MISNPILESPTVVVSLFVLEDHGIVTQVSRSTGVFLKSYGISKAFQTIDELFFDKLISYHTLFVIFMVQVEAQKNFFKF